MTVFIVAALIVCAVGWLYRYISCLALIYYIEKSGYIQPNEKDMKECIRWVVEKMLRGDR